MTHDTTTPCAGRPDELLDLLDGRLEPAAAGLLRRHLAHCEACQTAHSRLAAVDDAFARDVMVGALTPAFDIRVLRQVDALQASARNAGERGRRLAEAEQAGALEALRQAAARGWRLGALDIVGVASLLWLAGQFVPRYLAGLSINLGSELTVPSAAFAVAIVTGLAVAAAFGLGRTQPTLLDA